MATKRSRSTAQRIVDTIKSLVRQPLSDESYEVPSATAVRRSKAVAAGPRGRKAAKAKTKTKAKARVAPRKKARPAARKKKR